jgi:hypothetical protein
MRKITNWSHDKCALSPIFATLLLAVIVISIGSTAFYFSNNLTTTATNEFRGITATSKQSVSERLAFENVVYTAANSTLNVYILNCGSASNLRLNTVFIYDGNRQLVDYGTISTFYNMNNQAVPMILNIGQEGYFSFPLTSGLPFGSYTIHLITESGSTFDYDFTP